MVTLSLAGCKEGVLNPKGLIAIQEERLLIDAVLLMLIVVVPVILLTWLFAWKFRASNAKAKYIPDWSHNNWLEAVVWTIPIIIIVVLAVMTWISSHKLDPYKPLDVEGKPLTIQVVALEWKWLFIYPDQKIATVNYVQLPAHTPVTFLITSDAPMNSFAIPQLGSQIYAMAGMQTKLHLLANKVGDYRGLSTNFSGEWFSNMFFTARVSTQAEFDQWVRDVKKNPNKLTMDAYNKLAQPTENTPVAYYTEPAKDLFNDVIMKYMMPMKNMQSMEKMPDMTRDNQSKRLK